MPIYTINESIIGLFDIVIDNSVFQVNIFLSGGFIKND